MFSPTISAQPLELRLIDDIDIHIAPVLLGAGIRLYDALGGRPLQLRRDAPDPTRTVDLRYRLDEPPTRRPRSTSGETPG